jgi:hypothetical protein
MAIARSVLDMVSNGATLIIASGYSSQLATICRSTYTKGHYILVSRAGWPRQAARMSASRLSLKKLRTDRIISEMRLAFAVQNAH